MLPSQHDGSPELDSVLDMGVVETGRCDVCRNDFNIGLGLAAPDGTPLVGICRWCLAIGLQSVTGYGVLNQLLSWETLRNSRRVTAWRGWRKVGTDRAAEEGVYPPEI